MAKIGLRNFLFGILTEQEDGTATYINEFVINGKCFFEFLAFIKDFSNIMSCI